MKTGNVVLAIFLWLCIPATFILGAMFGGLSYAMGGNPTAGVACAIGAPLILFILGLVALITGMEKPSVQPAQHVAVEKHHYERKDIPKKEELDEKREDKSSKNEKNTKFCFNCGAKLEDSPKFCYKCGSTLR